MYGVVRWLGYFFRLWRILEGVLLVVGLVMGIVCKVLIVGVVLGVGVGVGFVFFVFVILGE